MRAGVFDEVVEDRQVVLFHGLAGLCHQLYRARRVAHRRIDLSGGIGFFSVTFEREAAHVRDLAELGVALDLFDAEHRGDSPTRVALEPLGEPRKPLGAHHAVRR